MPFGSVSSAKFMYLGRALKRLVIYTSLLAGIGGGIGASASTPTTTTLALTSGGTTVTTVAVGSVVTLTATVKAGSTAVTVGQVKFCDASAAYCEDSAVLGTAQLTAAGTAMLNLRLGIGSHSVKALFAGTTTNAESASSSQSLTVTGKAWSSTALVSAGVPGNYALTATVAGGGTSAPTGSVDFEDSTSNTTIDSAVIDSNTALQSFGLHAFPSSVISVAVGDFNHDGIPDLAVTSGGQVNPYIPGHVNILLGKGDGTFLSPVTYATTDTIPNSIATADLNGDGNLDLVVTDFYAGEVSVFLGNGDGTFKSQQVISVGSYPSPVLIGDFNHDGILDLIIGCATDPVVYVLLGNGDGTFSSPITYATETGARSQAPSIAVADFNGDGNLDVAELNVAAGTLGILTGKGDGTFQAQTTVQLSNGPYAIAAGDFNDDGKPDLAVLYGGSFNILLGKGDGTFEPQQTYSAGSWTLAIGDLNGDGKLDVVTSGSVYFGNGDGTFQSPLTVNTGNCGAVGVAIADFNGDGHNDIATCGGISATSGSVLINEQMLQTTISKIALLGGTPDHAVVAVYSGDSVYSSSTSNAVTLARGISTSLTLAGTPTGIVAAGTTVQLTATLTPATYNSNAATGTVTFSDNGTAIGTPVSLSSSGTATLTTGSLPAGEHDFTAAYSGDSNFAAAQSGTVAAWATIPSSTALAVSSNSVAPQTAITFTATVLNQSNVPITAGQVQFCNAAAPFCTGAALLGTAELTATGTATLILRLGVGTYSIDAVFMGSAAAQPSKSGAQGVAVVGKSWSTSALALTGVPGNYTLTDTVAGGGATVPTGKITFEDASNGNAAVATPSLDSTTAQVTFAETDYPGGSAYYSASIAVADLNGDGKPDVVAVNPSNNTVDVLIGNGDGTFQGQKGYPVGNFPTSVAVGDLNGDGHADLVVTNATDGTIGILLGNGDGTFQTQKTLAVGASYVVIGDFNGDGKLDLAVPGGVLLGNGDGTFQTELPFSGISGIFSLAIGDFNHDGIPDLAVLDPVSQYNSELSILIGRGDGTFAAPVHYTVAGDAQAVAVGDFNGDGKLDIVISSYGQGIGVLLGNGDGTFQAQTIYSELGDSNGAVTVGDFNGDGKLDVAVANSLASYVLQNNGQTYVFGGGVYIFTGNGDGTFQSPAHYGAGDWRSVAVGDFNGDGRLDLAFASPENSTVPVLLNEWQISAAAKQVFVLGGPATHSVVASYPGDTNYQSSTSNAVNLVRGVSTALALAASPNGNIQAGQTVQLTSTLAPAIYSGSPATGSVTFYDNGAAISTQTIGSSGQNIFSTAGLTAGGHSYTVVYAGDSNFAPATSLSQVVWASSSTTTSFSVSSNSVSAGTPVVFTASVSYQGSTPVAGGEVEFCDASAMYCEGTALLGTATLTTAGKASASLRLGIGNYSVKAVFVGNASASGSASSAQAVTITGKSPTVTTLSDSGVPGQYTLVAAVAGGARSTPTGSVTFEDTSNANATVATAQLSGTASVLVSPSTYQTGNGPRTVAWGDLNGDGIPDLVVVNRYDNTVSVLLGKGDGTFQSQVTYPTGTQPTSVAIGDINGDGKPDIAVSNYGDDTIGVLLGNGDGTFQTQKTYGAGNGSSVVGVADFNGDGKLDLAATNYSDNTVDVLLGNGDGTFQTAMTFATGVQPSCLAVGDLNGDGRPDLATCDSADNTISVLLGKGDGTFQPRVTHAVGYTPYSVVIADLNGDGKQDVAVVNSTLDVIAFPPTNPVSVFLGNGDGTLQSPKTYPVGNVPISIAVGDFNGDGKPDLAVANRQDNTVSVLFGNGDGSFQPQVTAPTGKEPTSVIAADFTGSGRTDLAIANLSDNTVSVLLTEVQVTATASNVAIVGPSATHTVVAAYGGDSVNSSSTSASVNLTSTPKTTPVVTVSPSPSSLTTAQSLTVTVTLAGTPTPTGSVTVTSGSYASSATVLVGGVATINVPAGSLAVGSDTLTASYAPDSASSSIYNNATGTGSVTVTQAKTTPAVTVSPSSSSLTTAQSLTVTVTLAGTPTPTGSVTVTSGSYASSATVLVGGVATINVPAGSLAVGSDTLTASYTPDSASSSTYNSATGTAVVTVTTAVSPSFTVSGTAVTVSPGATTGNTSTITVTPSGGFTGSVALTAVVTASPNGAQYPPTLSFGSTTPVSITGTTAGTATLTVSTTAATSATLVYPNSRRPSWYAAGGAALACLLFFGIPARRRSWRTMLGMLFLLVALGWGALACGGGGSGGGGGGGGSGGNPGTTAGAYTVTVTGTSGSLTQTATLTVTVN